MKSAKEIFNTYLTENNIRYSDQRNLILDIFLKTEKHLTVADLFELAKKKNPKIGYATIYRAMKVLCDAGIAEESNFGDGVSRFEHKYGHDHHDHLICIKCGKLIEVLKPEIEKMQEEIVKEHGFIPVDHKLQIFGYCKKCS